MAVTDVASAVADEPTRVQLGWPQLLADLAGRCHTVAGSERAAGLLPLADPDSARHRLTEIAEARALIMASEPLRFGGITDVSELVQRAVKGARLDGGELIAVADTARGCDGLRRHLAAHCELAATLDERARAIPDLSAVHGPILESFGDDGQLLDHASEALGRLRKGAQRARAELEAKARALVDSSRIADALQDRYYTERDDRCVLPVKVEARSRVPGIVHGTSQSGQTVFIEPEPLVELGNQLVLAHHAVADEERRILSRLSAYVAEDAEQLTLAMAVAVELDVVCAAASMADALDARVPDIASEGDIALLKARHPLMVLSGKPCVPNDLQLAGSTALVISGPNAGGKTVALKTVGLCALMIRAGLPIPVADESTMPWLHRIASDIGDAQSIENDLSTFSAHLSRLRDMAAIAGPGSLMLFDELCVGTDPEQGAALAQAVVESLLAAGSSLIVTTHYERLVALASAEGSFRNASVGFDFDAMMPTFRLTYDLPGSSGALALARRLRLPAELVDRAEALLGTERTDMEQLLATVASLQDELSEQQKELARQRLAAERDRAEAEDALARAAEREKKARQAHHDEAVAALREARKELDELKSQVRRRRREVVARGSSDQHGMHELGKAVSGAAARIASHRPVVDDHGVVPTIAQLAPGMAVRAPALGAKGQVIEVLDDERVSVRIGSLKTTVPIGDLRLVGGDGGGGKPAPAPSRGGVTVQMAEAEPDASSGRAPHSTLDIRGQRVESALAELDRFVDRSMRDHHPAILVIHGHGTGALRNAVRRELAAHPAVASVRPGEPGEGGDGVTIAALDV